MSHTAKRTVEVYNIMFGKKLTDFWKQNNKTKRGYLVSTVTDLKVTFLILAEVDRRESRGG